MTREYVLIIALFVSTAAMGCATAPHAEAAQPSQPSQHQSAAAAPSPRAIEKPIARISFAAGERAVRRGEQLIPDAASGMALLPFDLVQTGDSGRMEILLNPASAGETRIMIGARSAFYFDLRGKDGAKRGRVCLLNGAMALELSKDASTALTLTSDATRVTADGTVFFVESAEDGTLLVSCAEGEVSCRGVGGTGFLARPGTAVEAAANGKLSPKMLPAERLADYRSSWRIGKDASLAKSGASTALALFSALETGRRDFESAAEGLDAQVPVLRSWEQRLEAGRPFGPDEAQTERRAVATALLANLAALPSFERPYYRLADLADRRDSGLALGGNSAEKGKLAPLFETFAAKRAEDEGRLGRLRRALYLFSKLNAGASLADLFGDRAQALQPEESLLDLEDR
jgi:ferric-dicitrate binding protein FerR (iron transport regulator)